LYLFLAEILQCGASKVTNHRSNSTAPKNNNMRKVKFLAASVILCLTFLSKSNAQDTAAVKKENPNAAEITFENEVHDYGTIKQGADGGCEFKFKNTGKEPLVISNARGSCGCTVPTWPKEPIMKGQTGVIKVHYDTKRVGAFTKTVTITSNAKSDNKVLTIKGVVEASPDANDQTMPLKNNLGPLENAK
jgi:hypothetical protein